MSVDGQRQQEAVQTLIEAFPTVPHLTVKRILQQHNFDPTAAAEELLELPSKSRPQSAPSNKRRQAVQGGWHSLGQGVRPTDERPQFVSSTAAPLQAELAAFPQLTSTVPAVGQAAGAQRGRRFSWSLPATSAVRTPPPSPPLSPRGQQTAPKPPVAVQSSHAHRFLDGLVAAPQQAAGAGAGRCHAEEAAHTAIEKQPSWHEDLFAALSTGQLHLAQNADSGWHDNQTAAGVVPEEELEGEGDAFLQNRREALRLTRQWQKLLQRSSAGYARGDHSTARQLAAEARRLRAEALAAHEHAAHRILRQNNLERSLGPFELDLHGLYSTEAVAALDQRLTELEQGDYGRRAQCLRVIVGRGNRSSGGEASLPRVIRSRLIQQSRRFLDRDGAIDVHLRGGLTLRVS